MKIWCRCKTPKLKEGRKRLRKGDKCLTCGREIKKYHKAESGGVMELRIANEPHVCKRCDITINEGELFFAFVGARSDFGMSFTWALHYKCYKSERI